MRSLAAALLACAVTATLAADPTPLFNGKNFDGWRVQAAKKDAPPGEVLDGKTEVSKGRFKVKDGEISIDPAGKGNLWIETTKEFSGDVTVTFQFKPDAKCNNDTLFFGAKFDLSTQNIKAMKIDEWNAVEIAHTKGKNEYKLNGAAVKSMPAAAEKSTFALRAEFGGIQIKGLSAK